MACTCTRRSTSRAPPGRTLWTSSAGSAAARSRSWLFMPLEGGCSSAGSEGGSLLKSFSSPRSPTPCLPASSLAGTPAGCGSSSPSA
eukprot:11623127-Alexandrium_andersonii.AAC.1